MAIEIALGMIEHCEFKQDFSGMPPPACGRIIVLLNGAADSQWTPLTQRAFQSNTSIDVVCVGLRNFDVSSMQSIGECGGSVILHKDVDDEFGETLQNLARSHAAHSASLEIHAARGLQLNQVIGPGAELQQHSHNSNVLLIGALSSRHAFTLFFDVEAKKASHLYLQFQAKYQNRPGRRVVRVFNVALPVLPRERMAEMHPQMSGEVMAITEAKRWVLKAVKKNTAAAKSKL